MSPIDFPELARLSVPEKILFLEELSDSIRDDESQVPVPASHFAELERRRKLHSRGPGELLSLDQLKARIVARK